MNFEITNELINTLKQYTENATITLSTDNKDWKDRDYKSDFVTIDEKNNFGFEVFDNEIIVFYFTYHYHFEDYSSELEDGEDDYIKRAKDFLTDLFENQIKYVEIYRGKKLATEKQTYEEMTTTLDGEKASTGQIQKYEITVYYVLNILMFY